MPQHLRSFNHVTLYKLYFILSLCKTYALDQVHVSKLVYGSIKHMFEMLSVSFTHS